MNTKHTPGPWFTRENNGLTICGSPTPQPGALFIADCGISASHRPPEETRANARLIAAAPELLTALLALVAHVEDCRQSWEADGSPRDTKAHGLAVCLNNRAGDMIAAAIAKATH